MNWDHSGSAFFRRLWYPYVCLLDFHFSAELFIASEPLLLLFLPFTCFVFWGSAWDDTLSFRVIFILYQETLKVNGIYGSFWNVIFFLEITIFLSVRRSLQVSKLFLLFFLTNNPFRTMIPITKQEKPLRKRSTFSIVFSQRAAGGGIAVLHWKWNGLSRAVLNFSMDWRLPQSLRERRICWYTKKADRKVKLSGTADMKFVSSIRF